MAGTGGTALPYDCDIYTTVRELGSGAGSVTELVACENTATLAVRKRLAKGLANPEAWEALAGVSHPLVPRVLEQGWRGDEYCVVYEFVAGESLASLIERAGALDESRAVAFLGDVASAASALHAAGIVHRDISPGNVIVDAEDRAHLTDLGIARLVDEGQSHDTTRLGTWGFAAPEQYGFAQTDARSDVFSMGRLLAYATTGTMPEVVSEPLDASANGLGALSPRVAQVITRACAFEPSARYQSAEEFAAALAVCESAAGHGSVAEQEPVGLRSDAPEDRGMDPRLLRVLRFLGKSMLVALGAMGALCTIASVACLVDPTVSNTPIASAAVGFGFAATCFYCAVHTWWALRCHGVYHERKGRVGRLLLAYVRAVLVLIAAFFVIAIIATAISGGSAG